MDEPFQIPRTPVESTSVASYGYDEARRILAVEFQNGTIYHYGSVDAGLFERFTAAPSKGSFFAHHVKGRFPGERMTGPCPSCGEQGVIGQTCADCGTAAYARQPRVDPDARD